MLAVGSLPEASDRIGGNDEKLQAMIKEMFGITIQKSQIRQRFIPEKAKLVDPECISIIRLK